MLADNGIGVPADASVELRVDDSLSKRIPGKLSKCKHCLVIGSKHFKVFYTYIHIVIPILILISIYYTFVLFSYDP